MLAYIDPGVGLLAWQALVAFFVGALFFFKQAREKCLRLFRRSGVDATKVELQQEPSDVQR